MPVLDRGAEKLANGLAAPFEPEDPANPKVGVGAVAETPLPSRPAIVNNEA